MKTDALDEVESRLRTTLAAVADRTQLDDLPDTTVPMIRPLERVAPTSRRGSGPWLAAAAAVLVLLLAAGVLVSRSGDTQNEVGTSAGSSPVRPPRLTATYLPPGYALDDKAASAPIPTQRIAKTWTRPSAEVPGGTNTVRLYVLPPGQSDPDFPMSFLHFPDPPPQPIPPDHTVFGMPSELVVEGSYEGSTARFTWGLADGTRVRIEIDDAVAASRPDLLANSRELLGSSARHNEQGVPRTADEDASFFLDFRNQAIAAAFSYAVQPGATPGEPVSIDLKRAAEADPPVVAQFHLDEITGLQPVANSTDLDTAFDGSAPSPVSGWLQTFTRADSAPLTLQAVDRPFRLDGVTLPAGAKRALGHPDGFELLVVAGAVYGGRGDISFRLRGPFDEEELTKIAFGLRLTTSLGTPTTTATELPTTATSLPTRSVDSAAVPTTENLAPTTSLVAPSKQPVPTTSSFEPPPNVPTTARWQPAPPTTSEGGGLPPTTFTPADVPGQ